MLTAADGKKRDTKAVAVKKPHIKTSTKKDFFKDKNDDASEVYTEDEGDDDMEDFIEEDDEPKRKSKFSQQIDTADS